MELLKKILSSKSFLVEAKSDTGKVVGEALFFQTPDEPGIFGARVDVKEKHRNQGIATTLLQEGDQIVRNEFPTSRRRFNDLNNRSYKKYTDGITDKQIIDINEKGILFKP